MSKHDNDYDYDDYNDNANGVTPWILSFLSIFVLAAATWIGLSQYHQTTIIYYYEQPFVSQQPKPPSSYHSSSTSSSDPLRPRSLREKVKHAFNFDESTPMLFGL